MNIHEYQAKELFNEYNIPVSNGSVAFSKKEIEQSVKEIPGPIWVVKAQVHAGGRGKGGGVKVVSSSDEAINSAENMFGMNLITPQTGKKGKIVNRVYIENGSDIEKELYLSCLVDRATSKIAFIVSMLHHEQMSCCCHPENDGVLINPDMCKSPAFRIHICW